ncbi:hypothetical protein A2U01_0082387, partial [Trifolium medium]|nr:hypothetical protein [Trifolium medium]
FQHSGFWVGRRGGGRRGIPGGTVVGLPETGWYGGPAAGI